MRKTKYIWIGLLCSLSLFAQTNYTVVLDAGHGGKDPGAVGAISREKDLNLSLVLEMGKLIKEQYPDVKVVYTRSTDVFIPLQTRADIANKNNADLFISIHTNASESKEANGVETFILGTEKMDKNLDVAMRENAVMKLESDYKTTYQGFDPNSIDSYIMFELMQNSYMDQSLQFATQVQNRFVGNLKRYDRGVRQAAFWVLLKSACPSILFEMGFISNKEEENYLNKKSTMREMAQALVDAFGAYTHKQAVKRENLSIEPDTVAPPTTETTVVPTTTPTTPATPVTEVTKDTVVPPTPQTPQTPQTYYALQVCASRTQLAPNDPKLKAIPCESLKIGDWYKYFAIIDTNRSKVEEKMKEMKPLFPDCWITTVSR